ncbi:MAG: hypothetical protein ACR2PS_16520 [Pseudomonadales bacterium]
MSSLVINELPEYREKTREEIQEIIDGNAFIAAASAGWSLTNTTENDRGNLKSASKGFDRSKREKSLVNLSKMLFFFCQ